MTFREPSLVILNAKCSLFPEYRLVPFLVFGQIIARYQIGWCIDNIVFRIDGWVKTQEIHGHILSVYLHHIQDHHGIVTKIALSVINDGIDPAFFHELNGLLQSIKPNDFFSPGFFPAAWTARA